MDISCRLNVIRSVSKCMQSSDYIALCASTPFRLHCDQTCDYCCEGTLELRTPPRGEMAAVTLELYDLDSLNQCTNLSGKKTSYVMFLAK